MGLQLFPFVFMRFLLFLWCLSLISVGSFSSVRPLCHDDESFALLQFKETFTINQPPSYAPANSKISSWLTHNSDCCMWDGVQCDENTGYVTSLDLSSSYLYGSINSSSSLFQLVHLQWLNLSNNNFNHSRVPLGVRQLSKLTYLNLSNSAFSGQIPSEILQLSKLVSLDIGLNSLSLHKHGLKSITDKLMNLEELVLSEVEILSTIPSNLANLSSLTSIDLSDCGLHGEFPIGIFQLPNLKSLNVSFNSNLTGHVPEFNRSSPFEVFGLAGTSFSGMLPDSIGNLKSLFSLDVEGCNFSGPIPSTFDNLTELTYLRLSSNNFNRGTLSWVGYNDLTGPIPSWLANLTQLNILWLQANNLYGPIPMSISNLKNLQILDLFLNQLSGTVKFDLFLELKSLFYLQLSSNDLSLHINPNTNTTLQKFKVLGLGSCHLNDFPDFLRNQDQLEVLLLGSNTIHGQIPKWIANVSKDSLVILDLSANFLTGFDQTLGTLPWTGLKKLDLFDNKFQVSLPIPPPSIISYDISNNLLHGEISQMICNLSSLSYLDLSYNNLSGFLPQCLRNLRNLSVFNLRHNNFHGRIPQIFLEGCKLRMISLNHNGFQGPLPSSLANCTMLEILDLGNNHIIDFFPSWLDILPELRILILQSNGFHGILTPNANFGFPKLRVIDLSNNNFSGKLPSEYFQIWNSMKSFDAGGLTYMKANGQIQISINGWFFTFNYPMTFTIKGIRIEYEKIQNIFVAIDLSSNKFEGEIPNIVGNLRVLHTLNLSNNILTGSIPLSLVNLTNLESLDLSQNMLSGEIPVQLVDLTFLVVLNVSHNHLTGPIPEGKQFSTFENSSFDGNEGLCGGPLSKKCAGSKDLTPPPSIFVEDQGSESPFEFDWKPVMMGYGCGFIVGVFVGKIMIKRKYDWFRKTFAVGHPT